MVSTFVSESILDDMCSGAGINVVERIALNQTEDDDYQTTQEAIFVGERENYAANHDHTFIRYEDIYAARDTKTNVDATASYRDLYGELGLT